MREKRYQIILVLVLMAMFTLNIYPTFGDHPSHSEKRFWRTRSGSEYCRQYICLVNLVRLYSFIRTEV